MKRYLILAAAVALALSACKQETTVEAPMAAADPAPATPPVTEPVVPAEPAVVVAPASQASFTGYGDMKLGSTLEQAKTAWAGELQESKPAEGSTCHYLMPKWVSKASEFGFMVEEGKFVRYDVGTDKETAPGGGKVGMSVEELQKLYGGALKGAPHKYTQGGQYLSMDAGDVAPTRLVFEVDAAGKVTSWRVGLSPQVEYVEGCS